MFISYWFCEALKFSNLVQATMDHTVVHVYRNVLVLKNLNNTKLSCVNITFISLFMPMYRDLKYYLVIWKLGERTTNGQPFCTMVIENKNFL